MNHQHRIPLACPHTDIGWKYEHFKLFSIFLALSSILKPVNQSKNLINPFHFFLNCSIHSQESKTVTIEAIVVISSSFFKSDIRQWQ